MSAPRNMNLACSFCGTAQREVKKLIAGPTVYICDRCVERGAEMLKADGIDPASRGRATSAASPPVEDAPSQGGAVVSVPPASGAPYPSAAAVWSAIAPYLARDLRISHALALEERRRGSDTTSVMVILEAPDPE